MMVQAASFSYLGIFFGIAIVIGYYGGTYADRRLHTAPWLSLVGLLLGVAASFRELFRLTRRYLRQSAQEDQEAAQKGGPNPPGGTDKDLKE